MAEILKDEELRHPLNETLLGEATKLKKAKALLGERLQKLEGNRKGVSDSVYQRVKSDYARQSESITQKFQSLRKDLDQELQALNTKQDLIERNLQIHSETIEEAKLRNSLGEFDGGEFDKISRVEQAEIGRLEEGLKRIKEAIHKVEEVLPEPPEKFGVSVSITHKPASAVDSTSKIRLDEKPGEKKGVPQLVVMEEGKVIQTIPLDRNIQIGRSPSSDVVLKEAKVSRQHAQIQAAGGKYVLLDLESSNGTYVDGKKISEYLLRSGDEIRIGKTVMVFKM